MPEIAKTNRIRIDKMRERQDAPTILEQEKQDYAEQQAKQAREHEQELQKQAKDETPDQAED